MPNNDPFTNLNIFAMQLQGAWPVASFGNIISLIHRSLSVIIIISLTFLTATVYADIFMHPDNLTAVVENLMLSLLIFLTALKAVVHIFIRKTLQDLVNHVGEFSRRVQTSENAEYLKIFDKYVMRSKILTLSLWLAAAASVISFSAVPLAGILNGTKNEPAHLIVRGWSPFSNMWSGYLLQFVLISLTAFTGSNFSTFIAVLITVPTCELKIQSIELEKMVEAENPDNQNPRDLRRRIVSWVKSHLEIIRYVTRLDGILNHILLLDFVTYSAIFCTICFQYIIVGFQLRSLVPTLFLVAMVNQIMLIYWTGNEIILSSEMLAMSAYNSTWYNAPTWYQTSMQIIIQRCQQPLKLRAWKLYNISLETFLKIVSAACSYLAILRHVYFEK